MKARDPGLWRYRSCIPVDEDIAGSLSLGEGMTPLVDAGERLAGVSIKVDYLFPTLSFKDRGAVVLVASAVQRGATAVVADSSGNAGSAIAAYAARAGLPCTVFVPDRTSAAKQRQIRAYGAAIQLVQGDRTATTRAAIDAVQATGAVYASHIYDPYFLQGTKTYAFELWEQLGEAPDSLIVPVGNGTLLLGAARGLRELHAAGLIDRQPALIAVQSERCPPLARAWAAGATEPAQIEAGETAAEGIAIPRPPRGAQILAAVRASNGCIVELPEEAIAPAQTELAGRGLFVEPTAALTWAAALIARRHPALADLAPRGDGWDRARELASASLVVPLCGSGLKSG
ncbi:MAG: pyridoxal-phosphate dependent enzyme [Solirubrobacteraceae bacterium]